jgi:hypothetical protein
LLPELGWLNTDLFVVTFKDKGKINGSIGDLVRVWRGHIVLAAGITGIGEQLEIAEDDARFR